MSKRPLTCEFCGGDTLVGSWEDEHFQYGAGDDQVTLTANVPVWTCADCGLSFTGAESEMLRHEAVCAYLGRLTPREIKAIRDDYGVTQEQFAEITGYGIASIKRWESAYQIPNLSADRFLRLLRIPQNFHVLRLMSAGTASAGPVFQTSFSEKTILEAKRFRLRSHNHLSVVR
ncbi:MAG: helix-turn-helix domain-containing protein [Mesorhizobium sp.]|nr:MAG: helix-turn-helix domain-containing protein [Mesorhizobium sp.]